LINILIRNVKESTQSQGVCGIRFEELEVKLIIHRQVKF
jgi:hypothetical protein